MARRRRQADERRPTLADVAAAAGVSAMTVSRYLRRPQSGPQSGPPRPEIEAALETLGYAPDLAARALASRRTNIIGALIPSVTNNVFADVLRGLYDAAAGGRYDLQLVNTRYSPLEEERLVRLFLTQRPAGLIVTGRDQTDAAAALLAAAPCPTVQIMDREPRACSMTIGFSHFEAGRAATRHLLERGYRALCFLGARMDPRTQRRLAGFEAALAEAGLAPAAVVTTPRPSTTALGGLLLAEALERAPGLDAVFCNNDDLALGALFEAARRRIRTPRDLGVCGFNDLDFAAVAVPSLTSVRTNREAMGAQAFRMLAAALDGAPLATPCVDLGFLVAPRDSTARG